MTPAPLVSVIVVCWNSEDVLGRCLAHLQAQDYPNFEILVVDDGSTDGTTEVAEPMLACGRLTILRSPLRRGCPHARNLGLVHAKGELIAFIDADGFATPGWLTQIVAAFDGDERIGGVASTVFLANSPLVLNGAGGTINHRGWAVDLRMNEAYETAEIPVEALYPMGCGMAVRRSAVDRVGPFDDRMLNYYDDVDYGIRLWRGGFRVVVAPDAWIDHGFGQSSGDPAAKRLLCEQHRMRVMLKHAPLGHLGKWAVREALAAQRARSPRHELKLSAMKWNARHLPSALSARWRTRRAREVPRQLLDPSWAEDFPSGVPTQHKPVPERASKALDIADPGSEDQLIYGWFPVEGTPARQYRWATTRAAALMHVSAPVRRLRLDYSHVPVDNGGVEVSVRRVGAADALAPIWGTRLDWRYTERSVENHPVALAGGDYEVVFSAREAWSDPPRENRALAFALARMAFEERLELPPDGIEMGSPHVDEQLVNGWFEPESDGERGYRWGGARAALLVRLADPSDRARIRYRFPPGPVGALHVHLQRVHSRRTLWSTRLDWRESADWLEREMRLHLDPGDYVLRFSTDTTWSNRFGRESGFPPDNRALGFALSAFAFGRVS